MLISKPVNKYVYTRTLRPGSPGKAILARVAKVYGITGALGELYLYWLFDYMYAFVGSLVSRSCLRL